jgi:hypothetical protein
MSKIRYGTNRYIEYHYGNINILLTVPHDGELKPASISTRIRDPICNMRRDKNTRTIALHIGDVLEKELNGRPFVLINNLHREKMDPNRAQFNCCENLAEASAIAYLEYHQFIEDFTGFVKSDKYEQALLLDMHGNIFNK